DCAMAAVGKRKENNVLKFDFFLPPAKKFKEALCLDLPSCENDEDEKEAGEAGEERKQTLTRLPQSVSRVPTFALSASHVLAVKSTWYVDCFMYKEFTDLILRGLEELSLPTFSSFSEVGAAHTASCISFFAHPEETLLPKAYQPKEIKKLL